MSFDITDCIRNSETFDKEILIFCKKTGKENHQCMAIYGKIPETNSYLILVKAESTNNSAKLYLGYAKFRDFPDGYAKLDSKKRLFNKIIKTIDKKNLVDEKDIQKILEMTK